MQLDYINPENVNNLRELYKERVSRSPNKTAYRYYATTDETWHDISWQACEEKILTWANALRHKGMSAGDKVAILIKNSLEWMLFEQAAFEIGCVVVPLYVDDRADNLIYILEHAQVKCLLIEKQKHWQELREHCHKLPVLNHIISTLRFPSVEEKPLVFLDTCMGKPLLNAAPAQIRRDDLASIVYTSGTTGKPKGVMLSHDNILQNAWAGSNSIHVYPDDHFLSFLPMSHMLERTVGYYMPVMNGSCVSFARSIAGLAEDLVSQNPSILISVPRIFERVYLKVQETIEQKPEKIQKLFHYAVETAWQHFLYKQGRRWWKPAFLLLPIFNKLFFNKIKQKFGSRFRFAISGGAALDFEVARLFLALDLVIAQGYGLTEYSPVISVNRLDNNDPKSVGEPLPGVQIKVDENQELLVDGKSKMLGYWKNEQATHDIIDEEGWLHTGDKVEIRENRIYITGRMKDIIVLSNGEKVPPVDIEQAIMQDPIFENVLVIGEQKPYLSALVVANHELLGTAQNNAQSVDELLLARIKQKMTRFPGYARIHKLCICHEPWSVDNGLLTPTLKPRRKYIIQRNQDLIDKMYEGH